MLGYSLDVLNVNSNDESSIGHFSNSIGSLETNGWLSTFIGWKPYFFIGLA